MHPPPTREPLDAEQAGVHDAGRLSHLAMRKVGKRYEDRRLDAPAGQGVAELPPGRATAPDELR
ncbi:hypothetical protein ABT158_31955 [Nonomuraea sp. NPDC001636]|uniref:hypothetical protein n=1 Tax=Nonomuraea sp. NPDC001636 TaxID=3154391 RepID=UPI00333407B5